MPHRDERGINPAFPLLIIIIILFVAVVYYVAGPPQTTAPTHNYFEDLSFQLATGQTWHVAVPLSQDGRLHLSISSNSSVLLYVKNDNSYLLNSLVTGNQNFTLPVTGSMNMLEVGVKDDTLGPALVQQFSCFWTP